VNLDPKDEVCPLGGMFTPSFTPRVDHYLLFRRMEGRTENFTPGYNFTLRGENSLLGDNFAPGDQSLQLWERLFTLGSFTYKNYRSTYIDHTFGIILSDGKSHVLISSKIGLGYILGDFFEKSSPDHTGSVWPD
jgi:hypothetical protein